jgi:hypothetical protein
MDKLPEQAASSPQGVASGFDERLVSQEAREVDLVALSAAFAQEVETEIRRHGTISGGAVRVIHQAIKAAEQRGYQAGLEKAAEVVAPMGTSFDSNAGERFAQAIRNLMEKE